MKNIIRNSIFVLFMATATMTFTGTAQAVSAAPLSVSDNTVVTAETVTPEAAYTTSGTTLTLSVTNGSDITSALNEALAEATALASSDNIYTVKVPAGSYTITGPIQLQSNLILDLYNVNISSDPSKTDHCMLIFGDFSYTSSSACKGYDGFENVTVQGGTLTVASTHYAAPVRLMHAKNITLKDLTVGGGICDHYVEVAALQNFVMDGCTLQNMSDSKLTTATTREALQFDLAVNDSIYPNCYQDGTMMKNVTIQNCTFKNVSRGIGSHSQLLNAYHENIKIINNTFQNVEKECIAGLSYYNCEISGNTMTDCGGGIVVLFSKNYAYDIFTTPQSTGLKYNGTTIHDAKTVIKNNTIKTVYNGYMETITAIEAAGKNFSADATSKADGGTIPAGNYYISNVEISNNTITTAGYGVLLQDAKNCIVSGNKITCTGYNSADENTKAEHYNGIHCGQTSTNNKITNNTITGALSNGMYFHDKSTASEITGNTIKNPGKDGITFSDGSGTTANITSNIISGTGEHGISLSDATVGGTISLNEISNVTLSGINIYNSSTVNGDVCNNTVSACKVNGINVGNNSKVKGNISGNKISAVAKSGIQVISKSSVLGNIDTNTISDSKVNGIGVTESSVVKGNIDSNKISGSGKTGIQIISKSAVNKKIVSNTVTNSTVNGICIMTSSKVKKGIEKNTIKKAKKYGIYVYGKSTVKPAVIENKISSCDTPVVVTPDCTVSIRKNTLSKNKNNYSRIATTSIKVKTLKAPTFSSAVGKNKKINLKWKKVKNVSGYYVELSTTADFKKINKTIDTKSLKGVFKKLKKGKTYYIRISAYQESGKARIYGNYSKAKKIKVK